MTVVNSSISNSNSSSNDIKEEAFVSPTKVGDIIAFPSISRSSNTVDSSDNGDDDWIVMKIEHSGGVHDLHLLYQSPNARPVRVKINGVQMWILIAFQTCVQKRWFYTEGSFDLGPIGTATVAFQAVNGQDQWPDITSLQFEPENRTYRSRRASTAPYFGATQIVGSGGPSSQQQNGNNVSQNDATQQKSATFPWSQRSPTAVTFTFEIGMPLEDIVGSDYECIDVTLRGKSLKYTFGEAHDCLVLNGDPIGNPYGGDNFPVVVDFGDHDLIQTLTLGLSTYSGEAAFHGVLLVDSRNTDTTKSLLVGANHTGSTWTYDRNKLGLNLWITSVCAPKGKPIGRYGFTLSSDENVDFNPEAFREFWDWFVETKHRMMMARRPELAPADISKQFAPLYDFLSLSFAGECLDNATSAEGWIYATKRQVCVVFDVFALTIYRMPQSADCRITLFVDGQQYNFDPNAKIEEIPLKRNEILAHAIMSAAQHSDLLYQMGLIVAPEAATELREVEMQPLLTSNNVFDGTRTTNPMARKVMIILAMAGLRKAGSTILVEGTFGWDIYSLASFKSMRHSKGDQLVRRLAALTCMVIQLVIPILLTYRAFTESSLEVTWDTYIARVLFILYASFREHKSSDIDREDRIAGWLCFFPEHASWELVLGRLVNKLSKLTTTAAQVGVLVTSYSVIDVTLNSLAVYFILDLDDMLVNEVALNELRQYHERGLMKIKTKLALSYRQASFEDHALPRIQELPAKYFLKLSKWVGVICLIILLAASLFIIIDPWVRNGFGSE